MSVFYDRSYNMEIQESNDKIIVSKGRDSDWSDLKMVTNGEDNGCITIRSQIMAEQLHFALGQMIGED